MKTLIKRSLTLISVVALTLSLSGCSVLELFGMDKNIEKRQALEDYGYSLGEDSIYWDSMQITANSFTDSMDIKELTFAMKSLIPDLDKILENAKNRNANIEDPEIKDIDDSYVAFITSMRNGYQIVVEAVDENDEKKFNTGVNQVMSCYDDASEFVRKLKEFCEKYNIETNEALERLESKLENFK